ncbi:tail fiber domain-containing protein [Nocardia sp. NPDC057668]|uniref:tail fiber domain-containing protein n=1 Tax=Nocardia sp. NPDC057668 TaxID=3346202 RepID=UPI00366AB166
MGPLRQFRGFRRPRCADAVAQVAVADAVNGYDILAKVVDLPISTWRYEWEPQQVNHLGPMAQDWMAAFGLGDDEKVIYGVDAVGVLLVCVQALQRDVEALRRELERQRTPNAS